MDGGEWVGCYWLVFVLVLLLILLLLDDVRDGRNDFFDLFVCGRCG